ncbi:MAG: filamentous hemagglutinin N-terminal domain-containing protein, partial [Planktomarina sp.]|nr:filamentous hemagglutinin N-terminal domain-containing protein [Planktomarina sp.]
MNYLFSIISRAVSGFSGLFLGVVNPKVQIKNPSIFSALVSIIILGVGPAVAETVATTVVPASGNTNAYVSPNGVPVVNIETANERGLSHNLYSRYNVEANGLVLNNGADSPDLVARQSALAGQIPSNLNLVNEATVILNEVVSANRSLLAGYTEVVGGKADVIVANPYGITCNGCGFINTDRATLTTGTAETGADGSLTGFEVNSGDVLIGSGGIDASAQQILDIVTRSVKAAGSISTSPTGSLGITTGNNSWNYNSRNTSATLIGNGAAPSYAIDSTALGGMYSGRIRIIATEAGVGVRMLGEAAASVDDFTLSSAGKIEIKSAISAARDMTITSASNTGSEDFFMNGTGAKISSLRDLSLSVSSGQIKLFEGELYGKNSLELNGATLSDVSIASAKRFAGASSSLNFSGLADINGGVWGSGGGLLGSFDSLSIGANSATIYAATTLSFSAANNLSLANAAISSSSHLTLTATAGAITTAAGASQGLQSSAGNVVLNASNGLTNAGTITSDTGSVTARVNGTLSNSGTLQAKTTLDIADLSGGATENITNSGVVLADGALAVKAATVTNTSAGKIQGTTGTTMAANTLNNTGIFVASSTDGQSGTLTLGTLSNDGTLQSAENLQLNINTTLANTGKILADNNLNISAATAALAVSNASTGVLQAGNELNVTGANATFNTQAGTVLGLKLDMTLASLNNSGTFQSNADTTLAISGALTNSGTLLADNNLNISAGTAALAISNASTGVLQAGNELNVTG